MEGAGVVLLTILFLAANMVDFVKSATAPAFLWSPHNNGLSHFDNKESVDYRILSPKDLGNSVLFEGGWSNFMCSRAKLHQNMDVALVYVGRKLQSSDITKAAHIDPTLLNLLKTSFTSSNVSMSFPYVDASNSEISLEELEEAQVSIGEFGGDNRAGIEGTLHRISAIRSRKGLVVGLTCRVGRAVTGHVDMVRDLLHNKESILFLGRPGVGKTTVMREIARVLADDLHKRVVIVDTSNEIGGDGDVPHSAIGGARRMQVPQISMQHRVMIEAVENHMPQVVIVDEIGTEAEALACRSIAERGVMLIGTAHGERLANIIKNPTLSDLVGGVETVTLGDDEARARRSQKSILERKAPPTFPFLIEMRERNYWVTHRTERSVDMLLHGKKPLVEVRKRDTQLKVVIERWSTYDGDCI